MIYTSSFLIHFHGMVLSDAMDAYSWRGTWLSTGTVLPLPYLG
jgi:hypothetical protein